MRNEIALDHGLILVPDALPGIEPSVPALAMSLQAELMNLGHAMDSAAFDAAAKAPPEWLIAYYNEIIPRLRERLGDNREYRPFYRNFPTQVMEASHLDLYLNALIHYWSGGIWEPPQILRDRGFAFENVQFRTLRRGTESDLKRLFTKLVTINQSLTARDKQTLGWVIDTYRDELVMPSIIPFKETLCICAAKGLDVPLKTATDVLRVAVYMSGGDVSLPGVPKLKVDNLPRAWETWTAQWRSSFIANLEKARQAAREKFKFKKFSRPQRRLLLGLLEKTSLDVEEMQQRLGRWLRLGEILHVGEHAERYPRTAEAFQMLRNQRKLNRIRTFEGRVDLALKEDWHEAVDLLATRPGVFARRLDWMLRNFDRRYVLDTFERAAAGVSSKVLFELYAHFGMRARPGGAPRVVMLKGERSKMKTLPSLPAMDRDLVQHIGNTILSILKRRMAMLPPMGKVWIDPRLKELPVPFAMRSVNAAVKTYVRGTRVPFRPDARVIRPFIHWQDERGDQDIDLSVGLYDDSFKLLAHVSFTSLKTEKFLCCHSGDVRHRKGPSAEYVDIDVAHCVAGGARYATVQAFNYNARPMHTVKDCVFGLMEREHAIANEVFVPKTISNCMPLANEGTCVVACLIDLRDRCYMWADVESDSAMATLESTKSRTFEVLRALVEPPRMSVHELLALHASARGSLIAEPSGADVTLRWDDFVTDYAKVATYMQV